MLIGQTRALRFREIKELHQHHSVRSGWARATPRPGCSQSAGDSSLFRLAQESFPLVYGVVPAVTPQPEAEKRGHFDETATHSQANEELPSSSLKY